MSDAPDTPMQKGRSRLVGLEAVNKMEPGKEECPKGFVEENVLVE